MAKTECLFRRLVIAFLLLEGAVLGRVPSVRAAESDAAPQLQRQLAFLKYRMALARMALGDSAGACSLLSEVVVKAPEVFEARALLAYLMEKAGKVAEAKMQYEELKKLAGDRCFAEEALGQLQENPQQQDKEQTAPPLSPFEQQLVDLINAERKSRGLGQLVVNLRLSRVARQHSEEMRDKNYFSHDSPTPGLATMEDRYKAEFREGFHALAENVARGGFVKGSGWALTKENIEGTHQGLMRSSRHRSNILLPDVTEVGVGIAVNVKGDYWVTEMFRKP